MTRQGLLINTAGGGLSTKALSAPHSTPDR